MEAVTNVFVAAGTPTGIHDLGRLLEQLNSGPLGAQIELQEATLRPLYRAARPLEVDAPVIVRREEIVFCTFEGPHFLRGAIRPTTIDAPVLLLVPPFQVRGIVGIDPAAEGTEAVRGRLHSFFVVRDARVFDADGNELGEGEQIVVNGARVQMMSATSLHIAALQAKPAQRAVREAAETPDEATDDGEAGEQPMRAA
jgi:hypothetical protein